MVRFALRNPYLVVVSLLALLLFGITVAFRIPLDILPIFKTPAVQILTLYPGMPTETMERDITNRIERWTSQANGIERQESKSLTGVSVVRDYFRSDIDPNAALAQVTSLADSDLYYMPPGTIPPMVMPYDPTANIPLALLTLSSNTLDQTQLYDVAYFNVRNMLSGIQGVIAPAVFGGRIRRILVYVDPIKLAAHGMSPLDVANALRKWNVFIPTGDAKIGQTDYLISANGMVPSVKEINNFPLRIVNGAPVFIKDIGYAQDSFEIQSNIVHVNGGREVYIPIYRQPGANTVQVVNSIRSAFPRLKSRIPAGIDMNIIADQSVYVRQSLGSLEKELILGAVLAGLMVLLFLGSIRSTGVVFLAIPLSILAAVVGLFVTGDTINSMTLGGLALAVGRLVDDAIVVIENINRHLKMDKAPLIAARDGAEEVAMPVVVSTMTTMIVFLPVIFLKGMGKFLFEPLALAVAFAMAASYILAMMLVPVFAGRFLKPESAHAVRDSVWRRISASTNVIEKRYRQLLEWALNYRWPVLAGSACIFVLALFLYPLLGKELFPQVDAGQFTILMRAPSGTRIEDTENITYRVEKVVRKAIPPHDLNTIVTNIGILYDWPAAYTPNSGPMDAFFAVQLDKDHTVASQAYVRRLRRILPQEFPGVSFAFDTGGLLSSALDGGLPSPIDVQVIGNSLETAQGLAQEVKKAIEATRGTVDIRVQQKLDYPKLDIHIDRVKAAYLGLNADDVVKNILTALNSSVTFQPAFWLDDHNGNHYFLGAQYPESKIQSIGTLQDIPITNPDMIAKGMGVLEHDPTLLRNVATISRGEAPVEVDHQAIARVTDVYANVSGRDIGSTAAEIQRRLDKIQIPSGYRIVMRGEASNMRESFSGMGFGLFMAIALVYLLLVAQFRSFVEPVIILMAVPLGLIGVIVMLLLTGTTVNIQSYLGTIFMVGIAVSNSVLLVEFTNRKLREGLAVTEAVVAASTIRLRPILMTSIAAIAGLLPMAFDISPGAEANVPLARAVVGGLAASTLLTLFVVPLLYITMRPHASNQNHSVEGEQ